MGVDGDDDSGDDDLLLVQSVLNQSVAALGAVMDDDGSKQRRGEDGESIKRSTRTPFRHDDAAYQIGRDFCGLVGDDLTPIFKDKQFELYFRISRSRFQRLMEDIMQHNNPFYSEKTDAVGRKPASFHAKLMLPLKTLAYGVANHCFGDYFQMSPELCRQCLFEFCHSVYEIYKGEYLRIPTEADMGSIHHLHKATHHVDGMFGSLDCMHSFWKNCPKAWQGNFQGKEKKPTIVLEAIADYNMWFWHAAYGFPGTLNDTNILALSDFLESLIDGTFKKREAKIMPYKINNQSFNEMFILVDGIYPRYNRFVRGFSCPIESHERAYSKWQEASRKDVERAFGHLQNKFQWTARPIHLQSLPDISNRMGCCLILSNMCVSDRVMDGDVHATYNPSHKIIDYSRDGVEHPDDMPDLQGIGDATAGDSCSSRIGGKNLEQWELEIVVGRGRSWKVLDNLEEHFRLKNALIATKGFEGETH